MNFLKNNLSKIIMLVLVSFAIGLSSFILLAPQPSESQTQDCRYVGYAIGGCRQSYSRCKGKGRWGDAVCFKDNKKCVENRTDKDGGECRCLTGYRVIVDKGANKFLCLKFAEDPTPADPSDDPLLDPLPETDPLYDRDTCIPWYD